MYENLGEFDINATFPLSKFVGGQETFKLKFAVMYHRYNNEASLYFVILLISNFK